MKSPGTKTAGIAIIGLLAMSIVIGAERAKATSASSVDSDRLTLTVTRPSGGTSRLIYLSKLGWQLDESDALPKPHEARVATASTEHRAQASTTQQPMTVFIDGPTGFTYVWVRDRGWKFVGRLSDRNR